MTVTAIKPDKEHLTKLLLDEDCEILIDKDVYLDALENLKTADVINSCTADNINLGNGVVNINITLNDDLFYKIIILC